MYNVLFSTKFSSLWHLHKKMLWCLPFKTKEGEKILIFYTKSFVNEWDSWNDLTFLMDEWREGSDEKLKCKSNQMYFHNTAEILCN